MPRASGVRPASPLPLARMLSHSGSSPAFFSSGSWRTHSAKARGPATAVAFTASDSSGSSNGGGSGGGGKGGKAEHDAGCEAAGDDAHTPVSEAADVDRADPGIEAAGVDDDPPGSEATRHDEAAPARESAGELHARPGFEAAGVDGAASGGEAPDEDDAPPLPEAASAHEAAQADGVDVGAPMPPFHGTTAAAVNSWQHTKTWCQAGSPAMRRQKLARSARLAAQFDLPRDLPKW